MIMSDKISVIVPIYRVEKYLDECILSIREQTYRDLEIILVNDGSPDSCGNICKKHASEDSRITVIDKENGGLSDARNAGLLVSTGEYIYFVDSDDRLTKTSVEEMYRFATENSADMVIGGFERFSDETDKVFFSTEAEGLYVKVMDQAQLVEDFYRDGCQAWAVLYSRKIHEGILFPKGEINEDEAIVFHIMERVKTAVVTNRVVYSYRNRSESITTEEFSPKKLVWVKHCEQNAEWIKAHYPDLEKQAMLRFAGSICWAMREIAICKTDYKSCVPELKKKLSENYKAFRKCKPTGQLKIRLMMNRYLPFALYRMIERARAK